MPNVRLYYDKRYGYAPPTHIHFINLATEKPDTLHWKTPSDILSVPMAAMRGVKNKRWRPSGAAGCCQAVPWFEEVK